MNIGVPCVGSGATGRTSIAKDVELQMILMLKNTHSGGTLQTGFISTHQLLHCC